MARNFPADIAAQKCLEEHYNKERDSQLYWYMRKKRMAGGDQPTQSRQMEVFRRKLELAPTMNEDLKDSVKKFKEVKYTKPKRNENQEVLEAIDRLKGDNETLCVEMRPITPRTREMLYEGFSRDGRGRAQYLRKRTAKAPEEKYPFPLLNSWEYGWKLGDVIKVADIKKPPFGRTKVISDTFYTRTGIPVRPGDGMLYRSKTVF